MQATTRPIAPTLLAAAVAAALSTFAAIAPAQAADVAPAAAPDGVPLEQIRISARNREELAQDVPVPVSVVSGKTLERDDVVGILGLTQKVPNLGLFGSNPRQTSISLRGIGKNTANDTMEPSVGVIVDGVASAYVGQNWTDWIDVDRVEVIRGPQGTLLGKNTTLGVVNIVTKAPSFTPSTMVEARVGSYHALEGKASITGPLVDGVLAWRGSFFVNKRDGNMQNIWQSGHEAWNETNRAGARLQFLARINPDLDARLIVDTIQSSENANKSVLVGNGQLRGRPGAHEHVRQPPRPALLQQRGRHALPACLPVRHRPQRHRGRPRAAAAHQPGRRLADAQPAPGRLYTDVGDGAPQPALRHQERRRHAL